MTAEIISFEKQKEPVCAFCKTPKSKAKKMVTSQSGKSICGVCVEKCRSLIKENTNAS